MRTLHIIMRNENDPLRYTISLIYEGHIHLDCTNVHTYATEIFMFNGFGKPPSLTDI